MSQKNRKNTLQGMEHLKVEIENSPNSDFSVNDVMTRDSKISKELIQIMVIMMFLFASLFVIVVIDNQNNFLQMLAEKIDLWI